MKRVLLTVAVALLIPGLLSAAPITMGVYFEGGYKLTHSPVALAPFQAQLYIVQNEYFVTAVEYQLTISNPQFVITGVEYPANFSVELGDPVSGHSITFWPPMTGYPDGYDLLATYNCLTLVDCALMPNTILTVGPHPVSGELRGTYSPENDFFPIIGLTSYVCPDGIANETESWGAIKSLYK